MAKEEYTTLVDALIGMIVYLHHPRSSRQVSGKAYSGIKSSLIPWRGKDSRSQLNSRSMMNDEECVDDMPQLLRQSTGPVRRDAGPMRQWLLYAA